MLVQYGSVFASVGWNLYYGQSIVGLWEVLEGKGKRESAAQTHEQAMYALSVAAWACKLVPLGTIEKQIERAQRDHKDATKLDQLKSEFGRLYDRFHDELESRKFLFVEPDLAAFYGQKDLFGSRVSAEFGDAAEDLESAGNCYALGQPTACVFHLMRAMEVAVDLSP